MGICTGSLSSTNYPDSEWKSTPENPYCFLMENKNEKNQKLLKWMTTKSQQKQIYQWRNETKQKHMVKLYQVIETTNPYCLFIITEQLIKLQELKLTLNQAYYIFYQTLEAYIKMVDKMGWFLLEQDKIFLDCQSNVKIWINRNLAVNSAQKPLKQNCNQQYVLSHLQALINSKIKGKEKIKLPQKYTFYKVIVFLKQRLRDNFIKIATRISKNLYHKRNKSESNLNFTIGHKHAHRKSLVQNTQPIIQSSREQNNDSISIFPHKIKFITAGSKLNRMRNYAPKPSNWSQHKDIQKINYQTYKQNYKKSENIGNQDNSNKTNQNSRHSYFVKTSNTNWQQQARRVQVKKFNEQILFS